MKFPSEIQQNIMDCGPTCLRIIARHYGKSFPLAFLRRAAGTQKDGSSLFGISKAAEQIGFKTLGVRISFNQLQHEANLPLLAHWEHKHFLVVYKVTSKHVYVSNPASGLGKYTRDEFIKSWIGEDAGTDSEGICLLLEPTNEFYESSVAAQDDKIDSIAFMGHYLRPHKKLLLQISICIILSSVVQLVFPFLTQNIVDIGIARRDLSFIWLILLAQLMLTVGQTWVDAVRSWLLLYISNKINISLLSDFFIKLMKLPIRYFDTRLTGDLIQRIGDHKRIEAFLTSTTLNAVFSLFTLLLYSAVLALYNLQLFGAFLLGSILYVAWLFLFLKKRKELDTIRFQQSGKSNSKVIELINGMQEIKLFNAEQRKRWAWEKVQARFFKISRSVLLLEQTQGIGSKIIHEIKNVVTTIIAASLVIRGELTLGMMLAVTYIIGSLNTPILQMIPIVKAWQDAKLSLARIAEIHLKENELPNKVHGEDVRINPQETINVQRHGDLVLQDLSFQYDQFGPVVLNNISLVIPEKKVTAIVGASGSGKTTLLKLLMRFYEPTGGNILIGSSELKHIDLTQWRESCGVVMQEGVIFNDTIGGNIAMREDLPDYSRLVEAARIANILEFIQGLPQGFNTRIGNEGLNISTGQKQRILIARAVYKGPDILFFDEATSSLDANNERKIIQNLVEFYKGKTVIIIAHRLSTVKNADNIVVLERGTIVETGTHDNLSCQKGYYYSLVKNQLELGVA